MNSKIANISINLVLALFAGAAIWTASYSITGHTEPWDADSSFYFVSLLVAGTFLGLTRPRHIWCHPVGIFIGQLLYILIFMPVGPLIGVGVLFLVMFSALSFVGAFLGSRLIIKARTII